LLDSLGFSSFFRRFVGSIVGGQQSLSGRHDGEPEQQWENDSTHG
jgi:hypothetical protein